MKRNYYNSRTSDNIDMKLEPLIKPEKWYKMTSTKFDDDFILANYEVIEIFLIYGLFEAIWKTYSGSMIHYC